MATTNLELEVIVPKKGVRTIPRVVIGAAGAISFNKPFLDSFDLKRKSLKYARVFKEKGAKRAKKIWIQFLSEPEEPCMLCRPTNTQDLSRAGVQFNIKGILRELNVEITETTKFTAHAEKHRGKDYFVIDLNHPEDTGASIEEN